MAASTVCWGVSFYFGCKNLIWTQAWIYANYNLLSLRKGTHPDQPPHPQLVEAAISGVEGALKSNANKARFYAIWQFRTLILGAVFFIGWRVPEMVRLTFAP